jgi:serine/threonine-protein kinase HipA
MATPRKTPTRARYTPVDKVDIYLWNDHLGAVSLDPTYGFYVFAYTPQAQSRGVQPSPLVMPLDSQVYMFQDLPEATYKRLPAMLGDALPDDFGNALIDKYMADKGIARESITALDRLAYMSSRGMGALTFKPSRGPAATKPTAIVLGDLVDEARKAVHGHIDDEDASSAALRNIIEVGTSAGGARAKAVIALNPVTKEVRSGQMTAPPGFEPWLLKFDGMGKDNELGTGKDYGRIEYAYYLMATDAGLDMSECDLLHEGGRAHFMTKRFDRGLNGERHHMQTLCAMNHLDYKKKGTNSYSQLFQTLRGLGLPYEAFEEAFRRMAFNVMARNCDDHTKNFSFLLKKGEPWVLAPAYDVTFAHNPQGEWTNQHPMSVNGKFKDFEREDLLAEASRFGIGTARKVLDEVASSVNQWKTFAEKAGVSPAQIGEIGGQLLLL